MSDLRRRFKFYGLGILGGTFLVILFFGRRSSCRDYVKNYMPNGRVLSEVDFLPKEYEPKVIEKLGVLNIDTAFVNQKILKKGEIDFERSAPREKPCGLYILNYTDSTYNVEVNFKKCKDKVVIQDIK
ncbi:hypothetical protein KRX57_09825 [Weeksellaceae bacterium TAE3-ERU29]|nr:hypothetical protein [Weeksellaceae bacterium TAE3-ERU29]